ncbi:2-dehydro-3-deoxygalactonokinase [Pelagerythrobacter rhizovicinus]|uniref:2-dehydro-3-deoxygalactonokinase n=1 Tax=Pelagerythrobacter rhizovicinus TaxID=2268576 RepID=A0A4Q2KLS7_9SPHN|nr:2-dehydro-3-deoxygalactonokinase [Pelagerythrobacter rhizovicinus]RXZ64323.1 2-dehydro-3-deoxygalactonokinase [Pelagerythrobacter rhizovicinus]
MKGRFLAVDWGTTNRRVFVVGEDGTVEHTERDDHGVVKVGREGFGREAAAIRRRLGDLPMLCAGMVGSDRGWADAGYVPCPARIEDLAVALRWIEPGRTAIVPGLSFEGEGRVDTMRGEEVQFLGAVAARQVPATALLAQPGTHCKWAHVTDGAITRFTTAITGEMFALLRDHSLLVGQIDRPAEDDAAFLAGVERSRSPDLLAHLFGVRADVLLGRRPREESASYASGLLIGADVAAHAAGARAFILAGPELGRLYARAIAAFGGESTIVDSHAAFVAGIRLIWGLVE